MEYILFSCRMVFVWVFFMSALGKMRDLHSFIRSIQNFELIPAPLVKTLVKPLAWLLIAGEFIVVVIMLVGKEMLQWGFVLGILFLLIFSFALASVLARKIQTSCNCFGSSSKLVSLYDLVRNAVFLVCGVAGGYSFQFVISGDGLISIDWPIAILITIVTLLFVLIFTQLEDIARLFR